MPFLREKFIFDDLTFQARWIFEWYREVGWNESLTSIYTIIWYVLSGSKRIEMNGDAFLLEQGNLLIVPPDTVLRIRSEDQNPFHYLALGCEARIGSLPLSRRLPLPAKILLGESSNRLVSLWRKLLEQVKELQKDGPVIEEMSERLKIQSSTLDWLSEMIRCCRYYLPTEPVQIDERIAELCGFINDHLHEELTAPLLAGRVHVSESHLRSLFQKHIGLSLMQYVLQERLRRARQLLWMTDYTVKIIAESVGFNDQSQFSHTFRRLTGASPSDYRKQTKHHLLP
ncbi:MAG TPA: AraC family transcriptional regulator [Bacilli bacterium]